jgi:putative dehydrogenase
MKATIGVVSQGGMGAGIGGRLAGHGHRVVTVLEGRSPASARRAAAAGLAPVGWEEAAQADVFLSVVPPGEALALARRMAPLIAASGRKPVYVDMNAIAPATVRSVGEIAAAAGARFADAAIVGTPPTPGGPSPAIYASGPAAAEFGSLRGSGLDIRVMDAPVGAASAVKICQSGLTKGYSALAAIMVRAAMRAGAGETLREELKVSRPGLIEFLGPAAGRMFDKLYRFGGEMDEIADFLADETGGPEVFAAFRDIFAELAVDRAGPRREITLLCDFYEIEPPAAATPA